MQVAYHQKEEGIESLKVQTLKQCNQRTNLHGLAKVALMQVTYQQDAEGMDCLKM